MFQFDILQKQLHAAGLNVTGFADPAAYDAEVSPVLRARVVECLAGSLPEVRSILVVGNGGPALWQAFLADLEREPRHLTHEEHPLEAFVRRTIERADGVLGDLPRRWFFAASDGPVQVDFRVLGLVAGLGTDGRLRLLMHPDHGPWMALRAACFLSRELPAHPRGTPSMPHSSLCDGCPAPCVSACPGQAFPEGTWNVDRCSTFHAASDRCSTTCHARVACPKGEPSRYPPEALAFHSNSARGRQWLRAHLGIPASEDRYPGSPPLWANWRERFAVKGTP